MRQLQPDPGAGLKVLRLYTDGASRGNPGPAAVGVVIADDHDLPLRTFHRWLGRTTNNEAEYRALIDGLKAAEPWKPDRLEVYMDSKLVVEQINGAYRVKSPDLRPLYREAKELLARFAEVKVGHVERALNKKADYLANQAIDEHVKKSRPAG